MSSGTKRFSLARSFLPILKLRSSSVAEELTQVSDSASEPQDGKPSEDFEECQDGKDDIENDNNEDLASCLQRLRVLDAGHQFNYGALHGSIGTNGANDKAWCQSCVWVGIQDTRALRRSVELHHPSFGFLHTSPVQGLDLYPIDVEGLPEYTGAIPGTVSLPGFAEECADYERCFGSPMDMKILLARNDPPEITNERVVKQLLYYQQTGGGRDLGVNQDADYADLADFLVYDYTAWSSPDDKYKFETQTKELYAWINRPDYFCNPAGHSSMAFAMHAPAENRGIGFTMPIRSTLDIADKYIRNVKIVVKDRPDICDRIRDPGQSLAQELIENIALADVQLHSRVLEGNLELLLRFAEVLEWPYLDEVRAESAQVWGRLTNGEIIECHVYDWIYGLFLPGGYAINKIMNVLVLLTFRLSHMDPTITSDSGLVLSGCSYWRSRTPLGALFASMDGVKQVCGWVGPCPPVFNNKNIRRASWVLPNVERVGQNPIPPSVTVQPGDYFDKPKPIKVTSRKNKGSDIKWVVPTPPSSPSKPTSFQIGKLSTSPTMPFGHMRPGGSDPLYDMSVELEVNQTIALMSPYFFMVKYNPIFITPPPCVKGPHAIPENAAKGCIRDVETIYHCSGVDEGTLVINVAGKGGEMVARAWCIQRGRHALIRRPETPTCFGCCLNLAYSLNAHLNVIIWVG